MKRAVALALLMAVPAGSAQAAPAEPPPDQFSGRAYIDTEGCLFDRVTVGQTTLWAQRLDRDGQPFCGLAPTLEGLAEAPSTSDALPAIPPNQKSRAPVFPEAGYYVQVGAFGQPRNADTVVETLLAEGYGVLRQDYNRRGRPLRVIYTGPFPTEDLAQSARRSVRQMGFVDAFLRVQAPVKEPESTPEDQ